MQPYGQAAHLAVAVSGGADSMALIYIAAEWANAHDIHITALTVDHGLRAESASEAQAVHQHLSDRNINHKIIPLVASLGDSRIQENARNARYEVMEKYCLDHGIEYLMTAHHLDDQFETFLMRLARGSGLKGLTAIQPSRPLGGVTLLRPLLETPKSDLIAYCQTHNIEWINDPSNRDLKYDRALIRKNMSVLEDLGLSAEKVEKSRQKLNDAQDFIHTQIDDFLSHHAAVSGNTTSFSHEIFLQQHPYLRQKILQRILQSNSDKPYPPKSDSLKQLLQKIEGRAFKGATLHNCKISLTKGQLRIQPEN